MSTIPQSPTEQGGTPIRQRAYDLAVKMTDTLMDSIERTEDELDDLRGTLRSNREILGNLQSDLMQTEIALLSALLDIRMCRFRTLGRE
jgi:Mg2+ and Co2+ transporter CorA